MDRVEKIARYCLWLLPLLYLGVVRLGFGFNGLYGQDAYEYLRYTNSVKDAIIRGADAGTFFWPVNYPLLAALMDFVIHDISFSLQLASAASLIATGVFICKSIRLLLPKAHISGLFVVLSITLSAWMIRASTLAMSDLLAMSLFSIGIYYSLLGRSTLQRRHLFLAAFSFSLAVFTRYGYAFLIIPFCFLPLFELLKKKNVYSTSYLLLGLILGALPTMIFKTDFRFGLTDHHFLSDWSIANLFRSSFESANGILNYSLPNFIHVTAWLWHPGFCWWIGIALLATPHLFRSGFNKIVSTSILLYALFLAGTPEQNLRYLMPLLPLSVLISYPGFSKLVRLAKIRWRFLIIAALVPIQFALSIRAFSTPFHLHRLEKSIFQTLEKMTSTAIYTFGIQQALIGLESHHEVHSLHHQFYETYPAESLILFNPQQFSSQWNASPVMLNWNHIQSHIKTDTVASFADGWILVRVP